MDEIKIKFDLSLPTDSNELPVPLMFARGYIREHILKCFEELATKGYGKFDRGSLGRGNFGKFLPNQSCPTNFSMEFKKKRRGRPRKTRG